MKENRRAELKELHSWKEKGWMVDRSFQLSVTAASGSNGMLPITFLTTPDLGFNPLLLYPHTFEKSLEEIVLAVRERAWERNRVQRGKKTLSEVAQMYFLSVLLFQVMLQRSTRIC